MMRGREDEVGLCGGCWGGREGEAERACFSKGGRQIKVACGRLCVVGASEHGPFHPHSTPH